MILSMTPNQVQKEIKKNSLWKKIWQSLKSGYDFVSPAVSKHLGPAIKRGAEVLTQQAVNTIADQWGEAHPSYNLSQGTAHLKGKGKALFNHAAYNTGANNGTPDNSLFNHEVYNTGFKKGTKSHGLYNHSVFNTGANREGVDDVDAQLLGMGFRPHHVQIMKGSGAFSSLWKGVKNTAKFLGPIVASKLTDMAIKRIIGAGKKKKVKFTVKQRQIIYGSGLFDDILSTISHVVQAPKTLLGGSFGSFFKDLGNTVVDTLKKPSTIMGIAGMAPIPYLGPALKLGSVGAKLAGYGKRKSKGAGIFPVGS